MTSTGREVLRDYSDYGESIPGRRVSRDNIDQELVGEILEYFRARPSVTAREIIDQFSPPYVESEILAALSSLYSERYLI